MYMPQPGVDPAKTVLGCTPPVDPCLVSIHGVCATLLT